MGTTFADFMAEVRREAEVQGPRAVAELRHLRERFLLARRFAEARRKRGWTQKTLAQKTGINQSEISTLESGHANPTYKTLQALAAALGCKIELVIPDFNRRYRKFPRSKTDSGRILEEDRR
jgi:transcriptional regulator with XRE-family HTH domain